MARYLAEPFMTTSVNRGKSVECFLGGARRGDTPTIRWVSLRQHDDQIEATLWEPMMLDRFDVSTVRDGIAARLVDRHADETRIVRVTLLKPSRDSGDDFQPPELPEPCAPRALLDV